MAELTPLELAYGAPVGVDAMTRIEASGTPVQALERAVLPALANAPCLVSFSGGTDSSLVLAAATRVARREGLADPVPITWRFDDAPRADESAWQERVVAELGLGEWERLQAHGDELDLVGPIAARVLAEHGVRYPANAFLHEPLLRRAAGGTLLTGVGGDQLLSPRRRNRFEPAPWLRRDAQREARRLHLRERRASLFRPHVRFATRRREVTVGQTTLQAMAAAAGAGVASPLLDPAVVAAVAQAGRFKSRLAALHALFGELLPAPLHERRDKALFHEVFWREPTRAAIRGWDGGGLPAVVDPDALRAVWSSPDPDRRTALLVQAIWVGQTY